MRNLMSSLVALALVGAPALAQVNTGGTATTKQHTKQIIGYITQWDAWKTSSSGVPEAGALTHLNIDYSKYTILNYSFFGVAVDGSLHSGDFRDKNIYLPSVNQAPHDIFYTDPYSSWDLHILFGELDLVNYINKDVVDRAKKQGFEVTLEGTTWSQPTWGLKGSLPLPLHKEGGAPGLLELAHTNGVKVIATIGGWSMCKHLSAVTADPAKRAKFVTDCKKLIATGFDGIDLDWEYPGPYEGMNFTGTPADYANFLTLMKEVRAAIGPDKLLTAAMSADPKKLQGFDWPALTSVMDYFNFMTYDYNGGWSNVAGHNSPLADYPGSEAPAFNYEGLMVALRQLKVPLAKVNFGSPFYGRGVIVTPPSKVGAPTVKRSETVQPDGPITTAADTTNWSTFDGTPNYEYIRQVALGAGSGWTKGWDSSAQVPYAGKDKYFVSYDDADSIGKKADFIKANGLAGTIVWTVYGDLQFGGTATSFGSKLKRWSDVKSPLVNKINEVFAGGTTNQLPTAVITGPLDGTTATLGSTVTLVVDARDSDGTIAKVEYFDGPTRLGETLAGPHQFTTPALTIGTHTFTAKATDNAGGSGTSAAVRVTVPDAGNKAPVATLTSPANGSSLPTGDIALAATATDADGTVAKVAFFSGSTLLGESTASPYTFTWKAVPAGSYSLTAVATDDKGATGTSSPVALTVTPVGNKAPVATITAPANNATFTAPAAFTVTVTATDADGKVAKVELFQGTTSLGAKTAAPYTFSVANLAAGSYTFKAVATDDKGALGNSTVVNVTVNPVGNKAPVATITAPANNATFTAPAAFTVTVTATDADGKVAKVELFQGTTSLGVKTAAPYTFSVANLAAGSYAFKAVATDDKGALGNSAVVNVTVNPVGAQVWKEGVAYKVGDIVTYNGKTYVCAYAHTSNSAWYPGASGLWFWTLKA